MIFFVFFYRTFALSGMGCVSREVRLKVKCCPEFMLFFVVVMQKEVNQSYFKNIHTTGVLVSHSWTLAFVFSRGTAVRRIRWLRPVRCGGIQRSPAVFWRRAALLFSPSWLLGTLAVLVPHLHVERGARQKQQEHSNQTKPSSQPASGVPVVLNSPLRRSSNG